MDPKQLYEQQVRNEIGSSDASLDVREKALLDWICGLTGNELRQTETRIAELSIGHGRLSIALARAFPAAHFDCIDISSSRIEQARRLVSRSARELAAHLNFIELNLDTGFHRLPRHAYSAVVAIDVLEHVFDPFTFIAHCHDVLRPDGTLFLRVPNLAYLKRRLALLCGALPVTSSWFETPHSYESWRDRHGWDGGHLHFFTIPSLRWLLTQAGFGALKWRDVGASRESIRRLWPGMLFGNLAVFARKIEQRSDASPH